MIMSNTMMRVILTAMVKIYICFEAANVDGTHIKVWDMFCCEGVKVLFRVALVLLKYALPRKVAYLNI